MIHFVKWLDFIPIWLHILYDRHAWAARTQKLLKVRTYLSSIDSELMQVHWWMLFLQLVAKIPIMLIFRSLKKHFMNLRQIWMDFKNHFHFKDRKHRFVSTESALFFLSTSPFTSPHSTVWCVENSRLLLIFFMNLLRGFCYVFHVYSTQFVTHILALLV